MPTDYDFADEKGRNASEEAARDFLWTHSDEIDKLHTGYLRATYSAYEDAAGFCPEEEEENPFQQAYEESQNEIRKRKK